jgi:hypothetical protein
MVKSVIIVDDNENTNVADDDFWTSSYNSEIKEVE